MSLVEAKRGRKEAIGERTREAIEDEREVFHLKRMANRHVSIVMAAPRAAKAASPGGGESPGGAWARKARRGARRGGSAAAAAAAGGAGGGAAAMGTDMAHILGCERRYCACHWHVS